MLYGKDDGRVSGRINTKVSKIATMFQPTDEPSFSFEEPRIRDANGREAEMSKNSSVVRTESHVARFINAKAMFEKMSGHNRREGKIADIPGKINDVFHKNPDVSVKSVVNAGRPTIPRISSLSPTGVRNGAGRSRSPSPAAVNGRKCHDHVTKAPCVATISSSAISPPLSPAPSLVSPTNSSPVPRSLTSSCRTLSASSSDSGDFPRKKEDPLEVRTISKDSNNLAHHAKKSDRKARKKNQSADNVDTTYNGSTIPQISAAAPDESMGLNNPIAKGVTVRSQAAKPSKPTKPDALKNVGLSSHEHHQELMQRHKNWFQSYSRAKSPSSPVKSDSERALSPDNHLINRTSSLHNQDVKSNKSRNFPHHRSSTEGLAKSKEAKASADKCELVKSFFSGGQSDLVKERAALFTGRQTQKSTTSSSTEPKAENFETSSTLPSKWCPPKQYTESHSKPFAKSGQTSNATNRDKKSSHFTSHESDYRSMPPQGQSGSAEFQLGPHRSSSVDELERADEKAPVVRRRQETGENSFNRIVSSGASIFRHSFHREPDYALVREVHQAGRLSSLEGDKERRLREWERKKNDREKRHSEGNLASFFKKESFIQQKAATVISSKGNITDRIKRYEDSIDSNNHNLYHSSIELSTRSNCLSTEDSSLASRLNQELSKSTNDELKERYGRAELSGVHRTSFEERKQKEMQELERTRNEYEAYELQRREQEDTERKRREKESVERRQREQEELEKIQRDQEVERIRREKESMERRLKEQEEVEKRKMEQEMARRRKDEKELERRRKDKEEADRKRKEYEERERSRIEREELERLKMEEEEREIRRKEQEEAARQRKEQDEFDRRRREREEMQRKLKEKEELERKQKELEDIERRRIEQEEFDRLRIEQEAMDRRLKEQEEIERIRREQEEIEIKRREQEQIERMRREQEKERKRREQEETARKQKAQQEIERRKKEQEQEELERRKREHAEKEYIRKENERVQLECQQKEREEYVRNQREKAEMERQKTDEQKIDAIRRQQCREDQSIENASFQGDHIRFTSQGEGNSQDRIQTSRRISPDLRAGLSHEDEIELGIERRRMQRKNEELFRQIEEEKEQERRKCLQEEIVRKKQEVHEKLGRDSENCSPSIQHQTLDSSTSSTVKTICSQSDEEENMKREKDRREIMKTKHRIAELKREREEIRKQQVAQMQRLLNSPDVSQMNPVAADESKNESITDKAAGPKGSADHCIPSEHPQDVGLQKEEIFYDHTVLSAQHKIELCGSPTGTEPNAYDDTANREPPYYKYPTSTVSSVEALPPPIPPHNVDPASLLPQDDPPEGVAVATGAQSLDGPEVMTPDEQQKLLSFNNDRGILSDAEATEARFLLEQPDIDDIQTPGDKSIVNEAQSESAVAQGLPSELTKKDTLDEPSLASSEKEVQDEGFVTRVQEVMEEDGVHYLEDGHFWIEIPGISESDDEVFDPAMPFHKHTKLKFSSDPIRLFSTHSVSDYDRKNDDVDPVAASAEYELEKRVEKMDVFPVQVQKGESGLGLSIIGMGVGADAGVEKLGIFVKSITPGGATETDGSIQVNDQIIEVDGKSLVGVTQIFAATVLKNTSGLVRFLIGREKDPDSSEVAVLIRQSLQADREREERRRALEGPDFDPNNAGVFFDSLSSASDDPSPMDGSRPRFDQHYDDLNEGRLIDKDLSHESNVVVRDSYGQHVDCSSLASSDIMLLRHHLQEAQQTNEMYEEELNILRSKLNELEREVSDRDEMAARFNDATKRLQDVEETLQTRLAEISSYRDMLEESQGQYVVMEKKYFKAKKIIKEYQNRERDFLHREDYHLAQLDEKDSHYNSLVKALKDRVIQLEGDLMKAQKSAGLPIQITPSGTSVLNMPMAPRHSGRILEPPKLPESLKCLDADISDTEAAEGAASEESRSSTVERKTPSNEDLDSVVPHSLLDVSASKAKGELATRGGLANRHLPSLKKSGSQSSTGSCERSRDDSLEEDSSGVTSMPSVIYEHPTSETITTNASSFTQNSSTHYHQEVFQNSSYYTPLSSAGYAHPATSTPRAPPPYHPPPSAPLTQRPLSQGEWGGPYSYERSDPPYRQAPPIARVQPVNRVDVVENVVATTQSLPLEVKNDHQQRLADQLKAVLAERESSTDVAPLNAAHPIKKSLSNLMEDVRQAVIQADVSLGKTPTISGPIQLTSTTSESLQKTTAVQRLSSNSLQQRINRDPWLPQVPSSTTAPTTHGKSDAGVVLLSQKPIDSSLSPIKDLDVREENMSMSSLDSFNRSALDTSAQIAPVCDWTKEQVAQWLLGHGLEACISKFLTSEITGPRLINLDVKDLKNLGLSNDDKNKLKKKVKDLRINIEKERKQGEKEKKEKERLLKKAEKLAEKAEKRKK